MDDPFGEPVRLNVNIDFVNAPWLSGNGLSLYFTSNRTGDGDLYVSTRESMQDDWQAPVKLGGVNSGLADNSPFLSADEPGWTSG